MLSERLRAIAALTRYRTLADVACDHGYLPVYLARTGAIDRAAACDIAEGPLASARRHIAEAGLSGVIEARLADGLAGVEVGAYETLVVAGVGGVTLINILKADRLKARSFKQLILQPQRDFDAARRFLIAGGFRIRDERALWEDGRFYCILDCEPGGDDGYDDVTYAFGKHLLGRKDPALERFIRRKAAQAANVPAMREQAALCERALAKYTNDTTNGGTAQ